MMITAESNRISEQTASLLRRPTTGHVRFSDVYPEVVAEDEQLWWRKTDFDSALTDRVESDGFAGVQQIPIGYRPWLAKYGLVLVDDLVRDRNDRVKQMEGEDGDDIHPDARRDIQESKGAVLALANYAPRDDENTADNHNGSDFYLAITDSGLEIYATPLTFLSDLDAQDRITALYRIPTEGHPEFNGDHEQFRSARVTRTRRHPDHLVPVFEYPSVEALRAAKKAGDHPVEIPQNNGHGRIAYVDKFGNVKLHVADQSLATAANIGRSLPFMLTVRTTIAIAKMACWN
jgi:hypothetical protein